MRSIFTVDGILRFACQFVDTPFVMMGDVENSMKCGDILGTDELEKIPVFL